MKENFAFLRKLADVMGSDVIFLGTHLYIMAEPIENPKFQV